MPKYIPKQRIIRTVVIVLEYDGEMDMCSVASRNLTVESDNKELLRSKQTDPYMDTNLVGAVRGHLSIRVTGFREQILNRHIPHGISWNRAFSWLLRCIFTCLYYQVKWKDKMSVF